MAYENYQLHPESHRRFSEVMSYAFHHLGQTVLRGKEHVLYGNPKSKLLLFINPQDSQVGVFSKGRDSNSGLFVKIMRELGIKLEPARVPANK